MPQKNPMAEEIAEKLVKPLTQTLQLFDNLEKIAIFKARVREAYRITIPQEEREALRIKVGDIVQVILKPIRRR